MRMRRTFHFILTCIIHLIILSAVLTTPVSANSAPIDWTGTTSTGTIVTDQDCPLIVKQETLSFDIQEFPQKYVSMEEIMAYTGRVTAQYTLHNPSDYTVTASLLFPFGAIPKYYDLSKLDLQAWMAQYGIQVNDEEVSSTVRASYSMEEEQFELQKDRYRLYDSYIQDDFYLPQLPVTRYVFQVQGIDTAAYPNAKAVWETDHLQKKTKILPVDANGFSFSDSYNAITFSNLDSYIYLDVLGETLPVEEKWTVFSDGMQKEELAGNVHLVGTQSYTLETYLLESYDESSSISSIDWYNACVYILKNHEAAPNVIDSDISFDVTHQCMQWYEYEITLSPGETITNTVTAPLFPSIDGAYTSDIYTYTYLLSPASEWAEFQNLTIEIQTPYYLLDCSLANIEENETGYQLVYDTLPEEELIFQLCEEPSPKSTSKAKFFLLIIAGTLIVLFIGVTLLIVILIKLIKQILRKKLYRRKE